MTYAPSSSSSVVGILTSLLSCSSLSLLFSPFIWVLNNLDASSLVDRGKIQLDATTCRYMSIKGQHKRPQAFLSVNGTPVGVLKVDCGGHFRQTSEMNQIIDQNNLFSSCGPYMTAYLNLDVVTFILCWPLVHRPFHSCQFFCTETYVLFSHSFNID